MGPLPDVPGAALHAPRATVVNVELPQLGSGLGEGIKNFKKSIKGATEEDKPETPKKESKA